MIALHWFWHDLFGIAFAGAVMLFFAIGLPLLISGRDVRKAFFESFRRRG